MATIRPFHADDRPAMQLVRAAAFAPIFAAFRAAVGEPIAGAAFATAEAEQAALLNELCAPAACGEILVCLDGAVLVGFVTVKLDAATGVGEIGLNAVHPDHAGRGIGTALYGRALARMRDAGMSVATVATGGDPSHAAARRAYAKVGFGAATPSVALYRRL